MTRSYQQMKKARYQFGGPLTAEDLAQIIASMAPTVTQMVDEAMAKLKPKMKPNRKAASVTRHAKSRLSHEELIKILDARIDRSILPEIEREVMAERAAGRPASMLDRYQKRKAILNSPKFKTPSEQAAAIAQDRVLAARSAGRSADFAGEHAKALNQILQR